MYTTSPRTPETTETKNELCKTKCGDDPQVSCKRNLNNEDNIQCVCREKGAQFLTEEQICRIPCDEKTKCVNGGTCDDTIGDKNFCICKEGTSGHFCEVVEECVNNSTFCGAEHITGARCTFDQEEEQAVCICVDKNLYFDERSFMCRKICDPSDDTCEHGSKCEEGEKYAFCNCKNGTRGHHCEEIVGCSNLKCNTKEATCDFDEISQEAFCKCTDIYKAYDPLKKICVMYDDCILKMIKNECSKDHEYCNEGECKCEKGYKYSDDNETCEVDKCASCPIGSQCDPNAEDPCKCKDGYFHDDRCVKYDKCDVGFSRCTQLCDIYTGKCKCEKGFKLSSDSVTCEINDESASCDLDCHPGSCIKISGEEKCTCPQSTHKSVNGSCIDLCTLSKGTPPKGLKCPTSVKCESDSEFGIRCKCKDPYEQAEDGIHCRRKEMCKEDAVIDECKSKFALCRETTFGKGYECYCDKNYIEVLRNGTKVIEMCSDKCDIKRDDCKHRNALCELNEDYNAECICPVSLTRKDQFNTCNQIARNSYTGELSILKSRYVVENKMSEAFENSRYIISFPQLKRDLKEAAQYVYGKNFKDMKIIKPLSCKIDKVLLTCVIELQLEKESTDLNALISPSYCYLLPNGFCIVKNLVLKREKSLTVFNQTNPCVVKDIFCDKSTNCKPDFENRSFRCTCKEGFLDIGYFNPVSNKGNLVEICVDINECSSSTQNCPENTICINTYGSYECVCKDGFRRKTGNLDPKIHGCEVSITNTVSDKKSVIIIGGVLGLLLVVMLTIIIIICRKLKKIRNVDHRLNKHVQKVTSVELVHIERNENSEMNPASIYKNRKLTDRRFLDSNRMPRNITIPRPQLPKDNNPDQVKPERSPNCESSHELSDFQPQGSQKIQRTVQYDNRAYGLED